MVRLVPYPAVRVRLEMLVGVRTLKIPDDPLPLIVRFDAPRPTIVRFPVLSLMVRGVSRAIVFPEILLTN